MPLPATARTVWTAAAGLALLVQLVVLYAPRAPSPVDATGLDKLVHLGVFAAPAVCGLLGHWRASWLVAGLAVHAPVSELLQSWALPDREGSVADTVADLAGVGLGVLLARLVLRRRRSDRAALVD